MTATKRKITPSREDVAAFLSGKPSGSEPTLTSSSGASRDIYSRVQRASRRLGLSFECVEDQSFTLRFGGTVLTSADRRKVTRALHQYQNLVWRDKWAKSPSQGRMVTSLSKYSCSNHWISSPEGIAPGTASFCFKARLNSLPTLNVL